MKKRKILIPVLAAILVSMFGTSCTKDVTLESVNTRVMEGTVYRNQWKDDGSGYLWCSFDWNAITSDVLTYGTVEAYVYDGERQCPLPHVIPIKYTYDDGTFEYVPENIRYDFEPGTVTFIMQDFDGYLPGAIDQDFTFRVVATVPVQYVIEQ